jgi:hypothetical protein
LGKIQKNNANTNGPKEKKKKKLCDGMETRLRREHRRRHHRYGAPSVFVGWWNGAKPKRNRTQRSKDHKDHYQDFHPEVSNPN